LSQQLVHELRREILRGRFAAADRLPSEAGLARLYDVSRPTMREVLRVLETEGLLRRQRGRGTFITRHTDAVTAGIERLQSFTETIRRAGYQARDRVLEISRIALKGEVARLLRATRGDGGILVRSLRYVDGTPVIYCEDTIPEGVVGDVHAVQHRRERESLLDFFAADVHVDVSYARLSIVAVRAHGAPQRALAVARGTPLILLCGTAFDSADRPLYASFNYVRSDKYRFNLIRR